MKRVLWFSLGSLFFAACGTAEIKWLYRFYHASPINVWEYPNGKLLGAREGTDKDLRQCKPTRRDSQGRLIQECVIVEYSELNKIISEYKKIKQDLIDCQKGR